MTLVLRETMPDDAEATFVYQKPEAVVRNEFTAIIAQTEDWHIAFCLEISAANGQGKTRRDALENLAEAILLYLEMRREEGLRGVPAEAVREVIAV
jgi:predicted RNase H-like HicB family nuclease